MSKKHTHFMGNPNLIGRLINTENGQVKMQKLHHSGVINTMEIKHETLRTQYGIDLKNIIPNFFNQLYYLNMVLTDIQDDIIINNRLNTSDKFVGDIHGSYYQFFYPLFISKIFTYDNQEKILYYNPKNTVKIYYLGDIMHRIHETTFVIATILFSIFEFEEKLEKKNIKWILGNHDIPYIGFHLLKDQYKTKEYIEKIFQPEYLSYGMSMFTNPLDIKFGEKMYYYFIKDHISPIEYIKICDQWYFVSHTIITITSLIQLGKPDKKYTVLQPMSNSSFFNGNTNISSLDYYNFLKFNITDNERLIKINNFKTVMYDLNGIFYLMKMRFFNISKPNRYYKFIVGHSQMNTKDKYRFNEKLKDLSNKMLLDKNSIKMDYVAQKKIKFSLNNSADKELYIEEPVYGFISSVGFKKEFLNILAISDFRTQLFVFNGRDAKYNHPTDNLEDFLNMTLKKKEFKELVISKFTNSNLINLDYWCCSPYLSCFCNETLIIQKKIKKGIYDYFYVNKTLQTINDAIKSLVV